MSGTNNNETAKQYLQRHNLHLMFEHMAYKVLSERPADPTRALFDYLAVKIGVDTKPIKSTPAAAPEKKIVFLLGGPGSGKGTQSERLAADGFIIFVSTGDLLRLEQAKDTPQGKKLKEDMAAGRLVEKETVLAILKQWVEEQPKGSVIVLDGFPREMGQALSFETNIQPCNFALYFSCPDDILTARLLERAKTSGRADDNAETIKNRLKVFHEQTQPAVEYYKALGKLEQVDANRSQEEIYADLKRIFSTISEPKTTAKHAEEHHAVATDGAEAEL
eukprot:GILI01017991.1.p1 GENE.GILI01017991.1~~GILI01017991.1.p1  ORF type:complete len:297 (-),score=98.01 GILI01017991.1:205-1035(-)